MKRNQKGIGVIVIVAVVALLILGVVLLKSTMTPSVNQSSTQIQPANPSVSAPIRNGTGLTQAENQLDSTNIDGTIDTGLNQTDADAQTFAPRESVSKTELH